MNEGYPERWVRANCVELYDGAICDRTWRKYKRICRVPDGRKNPKDTEPMVDKTYAQRLFMLAYMRCEQKRGNKHPAGWQSRISLKEIITRLNQPATKVALDQALGNGVRIDGVLGKDVPNWLQRQLGKSVSVRTLRRWAKKNGVDFCSHLPVPIPTLNLFLQI